MIRDFVQWTATFGETSDLEQLSSCRVGVEAADYLSQRILNHARAKEPLVPALGGLPLALKQHIEEDLDTFRSFDIEPWFVFSGLDITKQDNPFGQKTEEAAVNANAWNLYDSHQAEASVAKFGESSERVMFAVAMHLADSPQPMLHQKTCFARCNPSSQSATFDSSSRHTVLGPR